MCNGIKLYMKKVYYNRTCLIMKRPKPDLVNVILIKRSLIGNEKKNT